jgi:hypothetical protein
MKSEQPLNYEEHLQELRKMTQAWADYLDGLSNNAIVVPLRARKTAMQQPTSTESNQDEWYIQ